MGSAAQPAGASVPLSVRLALVVTGCSAIVGQIVLMREFLIAAYGNELSLGIMLALWLAFTAIGSSLLGWVLRGVSSRRLLSVLLIAEAMALYAAIWIIRGSRLYWHATPGEILSPVVVFWIALLGLAIFCPISGALFAVGSRVYGSYADVGSDHAGSSMYLLEALGSTIGGILASIIFIQVLGSLQIASFVVGTNLVAAIWVATSTQRTRWMLSAVALAVAVACAVLAPNLERAAVARLWPGFTVVTTRTSAYGSLTVIEAEGSRSIVQNGVVLFTAPDQAFAEEAVHFPMLEHPSPNSVLLIGGGLNGSIVEILKYPSVRKVDYVELDPAVVQLAREYFPNPWSAVNAARVHIHEIDGRLFLRSTDQRFDVIILNLPEPQTGQINRFYTEEFFRQVGSHLARGGIFGFQMRASEEYLSPRMADFLRCLNATLRRVFADTVVLPGENVHFLGSQQPGILSTDPKVLLVRLRERGVHTEFVREYYLPFRMAPDRISDLDEQLRPTTDTRINRDFTPIAYFFDIELWASQFSGRYGTWFERAARIPARIIFGCLILLLSAVVAAFTMIRDRSSRIRLATAASVAAMGFTVMTIEIALLLGFQAVHGYVFKELALITAGFMSGMAIGSWGSLRSLKINDTRTSAHLWRVGCVQFAATAAVLLVTPLITWAGAVPRLAGHSFLVQGVFLAMALSSGAIGGYQFPVAMHVLPVSKKGAMHAPGILYGLDLLGASLGALLISIYLLPVFGFNRTAELTALANTAPILILALSLPSANASQN